MDSTNLSASAHNSAVLKMPERWLEEAAPTKKAGILKLFLGYAPGVSKTYCMLSEAIRRHGRGEDVVIGVIETHGRRAVARLAAKIQGVSHGSSSVKALSSRRRTWLRFLRDFLRSRWWINWRTRDRARRPYTAGIS